MGVGGGVERAEVVAMVIRLAAFGKVNNVPHNELFQHGHTFMRGSGDGDGDGDGDGWAAASEGDSPPNELLGLLGLLGSLGTVGVKRRHGELTQEEEEEEEDEDDSDEETESDTYDDHDLERRRPTLAEIKLMLHNEDLNIYTIDELINEQILELCKEQSL